MLCKEIRGVKNNINNNINNRSVIDINKIEIRILFNFNIIGDWKQSPIPISLLIFLI